MKRLAWALVLWAGMGWAQETTELLIRVVDSESGQGVAGAKVILRKDAARIRFGSGVWEAPLGADEAQADQLVALTGDLGQFTFRVPKQASYRVFVAREGYVQWGMSLETQRVVKASEGRLEVVIRKEAEVSGRVVDVETRAGLPGMEVVGLVWDTFGDTRALSPGPGRALTDEQGRFRMTGLKPGEYVLQVERKKPMRFEEAGETEEYRARDVREYGVSYYPGVARREEAAGLTVLGGAQIGGLEFRLAKRRVGAIRGQITGQGKVTLGLFLFDQQGDSHLHRRVTSAEVEAAKGFRLEDVPPGRYWLMAEQGEQAAILQFDMDDRRMDALDLTLGSGTTVHGTVRAQEGLENEWKKVERVWTTLLPLERMRTRWDQGQVWPQGPERRFEIGRVLGGRVRVLVGGLPKGMEVGEVLYLGQVAPRGVFEVNPAALEQKLEVVVWPATASLSISVRRGTKAEAAAEVVAFREPFEAADAWDSKKTAADGEGRALLANLLAGQYRIFAVPKATPWRTDPRLRQWLHDAPLVELSAGATRALELKVIEP